MSFAAKVEKLMFTVGLTDKTAGPVGAINARIDKLTQNAQKGFRNVGYGMAGIAGATLLLNRAMAPAIEQQRALNEVASLDVEPKSLKKLNQMALQTQAQFGTASADIIRSAYDIQSAIAGLNGDELSKFTKNSAILAKGTKSDASTITNYMGTMFGIFKDNAKKMGNSAWIDQLTGQTATAVQIFKTTGTQMSGAFTSLGAEGQAALIPMHEQMAVLGQLQATMSGSEAGTKYKSFLQNVGRAQKSLGLQFTDSQGRMLPIVNIMEKIQGKFGQIDTVAKSGIIQKAFGSDEAVALVKLLVADTQMLGKNIDQLGNVQGMQKATKMAKAMTDPWQQLTGTVKSVHTAFSQALMPVLQPTIEKITEAGSTLLRWTQMFPNLTSAVSTVGLAVIGLIASIAALTIVVGIYRFMAVGWGVIHMALLGETGLLSKGIDVLARSYKFARRQLAVFQILSATSGGSFAALRVIMASLTAGVWKFTVALLANPITWIIVGVVALGAAVYGIIKYWDELSSAVTNFLDKSVIFQAMRIALDVLTIPMQLLWIGLKKIGSALVDMFNNTTVLAVLGQVFDTLTFPIRKVWQGLKWIAEGIANLTGFNFDSITNSFKSMGNMIDFVFGKADSFAATLKSIADNGVINTVMSLFTDETKTAKVLNQGVESNIAKTHPQIAKQPNLPAQNTVVPLNVERQLSANTPVVDQPKLPAQNTVVPLHVDRQISTNTPVVEQPKLPAQNTVVPLNVERQLSANTPVVDQPKLPAQNVVVPLNVEYQINKNLPDLSVGNNNVHNIKQQQEQSTKQKQSVSQSKLDIPQGGIFQQLKQLNNSTNNSGMSIEHVTIKTEKLDNAESLQQQLLMAAM